MIRSCSPRAPQSRRPVHLPPAPAPDVELLIQAALGLKVEANCVCQGFKIEHFKEYESSDPDVSLWRSVIYVRGAAGLANEIAKILPRGWELDADGGDYSDGQGLYLIQVPL